MRSNVQIASNIMVDDEQHNPHSRFIPGDFYAQIYPEYLNPEFCHQWMTQRQIMEYRQYLVCRLCHRTCAGTCGLCPPGR
jgi:hypothetical protein